MTQPAPTTDATSSDASQASRRRFLGTSAAASMAAGLAVHSSVEAAEETRELRLAVVGCGGRGSGAINDSLSINDNIKLVAAADLYATKADPPPTCLPGRTAGFRSMRVSRSRSSTATCQAIFEVSSIFSDIVHGRPSRLSDCP